jgi:stress-induced morphogen
VRSDRFGGLSLIEQHRLVYAPVQHLLDDGSIHALQIKTEAT